MTRRDWIFVGFWGVVILALLATFGPPGAEAGGINTAGGLCPDGIQEGEGWTSTSKWERLPMSEGLRDEQVSDKFHYVEMTVYMCNDGSLMGRAEFRPGKKGR